MPSICAPGASRRAPASAGASGTERVGEGEIEQCERTSVLRQGVAVLQRGCLRDLIPVVLDRRAPELCDLGLVGGAGGAAELAETHDFVERGGVGGARERRRRPGSELVRAQEGK